jgi:chaperonin GroES
MQIQPLGNRILIQPIDNTEDSTNSSSTGIVTPTLRAEPIAKGVVVAQGEGISPAQDLLNKTVLYDKHAGDEVEEEGVKYRLIKIDNVLAVILVK